ncbi:MAG: Spo0E family sporulation regulatory protein-aspartic acid phosphatase [Lachnospiraceae bacterium]|nr:Spo0E family sporulation regulatory protein-aspartic acid phosphatase [Lachnospiraceae bacterium]
MNTSELLKEEIEKTRARMDKMLDQHADIMDCYDLSVELDRLIAEYIRQTQWVEKMYLT